ncbi:MAG: hypothetical protein GEV05_17460 [Betaproteobacteria bacterium]|nr:hypothetical protein [Betaproteobacteria bacterium]
MDRSLLVSWYDLATATRSRYLDWLHGTYIPKLLQAPGALSAAHYEVDQNEKPLAHLRHTGDETLPQGGSHIFILAARDAHVFADLTPFRYKPNAAERRMLALRQGERVNIFTEEHRAQGPEARRREGRYTLAPAIQLGNFNSGSYPDEDELLSWYAHLRLPNFQNLPGGICIRKMVSVSGWAKHGVLYEFTSLEARARSFRAHEAKNRKLSAWTHDVVAKLVHAPGSPAVAQRIWPPVKVKPPAQARKRSARA